MDYSIQRVLGSAAGVIPQADPDALSIVVRPLSGWLWLFPPWLYQQWQ
jgi:hypothetical protein